MVDHCIGKCLGVRAARRGTRLEAIKCLRAATHVTKGHCNTDTAEGTVLRHDHGSQFDSHRFQDGLKTLGIASNARGAPPIPPQGGGVSTAFNMSQNLAGVQPLAVLAER